MPVQIVFITVTIMGHTTMIITMITTTTAEVMTTTTTMMTTITTTTMKTKIMTTAMMTTDPFTVDRLETLEALVMELPTFMTRIVAPPILLGIKETSLGVVSSK